MNIWQDIKWQYQYGSTLIKIILLNVAVFIVLNLISLPFALMAKSLPFNVVHFLALPASVLKWLYQPWSIFTYMFVHVDFFHILFNMLGLYWFGQIVQDLIGKPKIFPIYLLGGISGGLMYVLAYNVFPIFAGSVSASICIGASASVMAMVLAAATLAPNYELGLLFFGPVKIKWIALAYLVLDLINVQHGNAGGHIAHLGGALFGFVYIKFLQSGLDLARPFFIIADFWSSLFKEKNELKVTYRKKEYAYTSNTTSSQTKNTNSSQTKNTLSKQEQLDQSLEKINRSSYDSLTKEEKDFLFKISQED